MEDISNMILVDNDTVRTVRQKQETLITTTFLLRGAWPRLVAGQEGFRGGGRERSLRGTPYTQLTGRPRAWQGVNSVGSHDG